MSKDKRTQKASSFLDRWLASRKQPYFNRSYVVAAGQEIGLRPADVDRVLDRLKKAGRIYEWERGLGRGGLVIREEE
jgi:hypothetical protein